MMIDYADNSAHAKTDNSAHAKTRVVLENAIGTLRMSFAELDGKKKFASRRSSPACA